MKKILFTLIILYSSQSLLAQSPKVFVSDSSKPIIQQQLLFPSRIIGKTEKGTVYALPQDNMPVLVPDSLFAQNMPNSFKNSKPCTQMPNPYYPYKPLQPALKQKIDSIKIAKPKQ